jgi:osmoprotectant transport system permease protein
MERFFLKILLIILICCQVITASDRSTRIVVGSKKFTENVILGETIFQISQKLGYDTIHKRQLGGTRILWNALLTGDIDIYPEYTGTISKEILKTDSLTKLDQLREILATYNIIISPPLGFNNTYAIGVKRELVNQLGLENISDLRNHPELIFGFTNEFMDRNDGWPGLQKHYHLPQTNVRGLDHDLAYRGLESGSIQVIDMYSTDAEIQYYKLYNLNDDWHYFPEYDAVLLYRKDLTNQAPIFVAQVNQLAGQITEKEMIEMNSRSKLNKIAEAVIAAEFLNNKYSLNIQTNSAGLWQRLWKNTIDHLFLVIISLVSAIMISIPLGITAVKFPKSGKVILGVVGIIQTIPSLALLVFMIPLLGIGGPPAIVALFLYSLLPIVRNTYTGIQDISLPLHESALALGLKPLNRLYLIELPLASRSILAGIKTSAVINVGTATLGALIGAGGYGQPILTGIRLDDIGLILEGAIPAAILALLVQWFFDLSEYILVPKGLRLKSSNI